MPSRQHLPHRPLLGQGRWFLGGSTEWPAVIPSDVEIDDVDVLAGTYPDVASDIRAIAALVQHVVASEVGPR